MVRDDSGHVDQVSVYVMVTVGGAPTVAMTSPATGGTVARGKTTTIAATATDDVGVSKVEFFMGSTRLCTDTTSPYTCAWKVPSLRNVGYKLQARACDAEGNVAHSNIVAVTAR